jgi:hypothetical protein
MPGRIFRSVSFWLLIAALLLFGLESSPVTGLFMLFFLRGTLLPGLVVQAALVAVFIEALIGRLPKAFALVPVLLYGAYYAELGREFLTLPAIASDIEADNAAHRVAFNPASDALAIQGGGLEEAIRYDVPMTYMLDYSLSLSRAVRFAALPPGNCTVDMNKIDAKHIVYRVSLEGFPIPRQYKFCVDRLEVPPSSTPIVVERRQSTTGQSYGIRLFETATTALANGEELGEVTTAEAETLPPIPQIVLGCGLIDNPPAWQCGAALGHATTRLATPPDGSAADDPLAYLLGLKRRTAAELATMAILPRNVPAPPPK